MNVNEAVVSVLEEEVSRQGRVLHEVCTAAGVHKNAIYKARKSPRASLRVPTLWALAAELKIPMDEMAFKITRRMRESES